MNGIPVEWILIGAAVAGVVGVGLYLWQREEALEALRRKLKMREEELKEREKLMRIKEELMKIAAEL